MRVAGCRRRTSAFDLPARRMLHAGWSDSYREGAPSDRRRPGIVAACELRPRRLAAHVRGTSPAREITGGSRSERSGESIRPVRVAGLRPGGVDPARDRACGVLRPSPRSRGPHGARPSGGGRPPRCPGVPADADLAHVDHRADGHGESAGTGDGVVRGRGPRGLGLPQLRQRRIAGVGRGAHPHRSGRVRAGGGGGRDGGAGGGGPGLGREGPGRRGSSNARTRASSRPKRCAASRRSPRPRPGS